MGFTPRNTWTGATRWRADWWNNETAGMRADLRALSDADVSGGFFDLPILAQPSALVRLPITMGRNPAAATTGVFAYSHAAASDPARHTVLAEYVLRGFDVHALDLHVEFGTIDDYGGFQCAPTASGGTDFTIAQLDLVAETPGAERPSYATSSDDPYASADDDARELPHGSLLSAPIDLTTAGSDSLRVNASTSPGLVVTRIPTGTRLKLIVRAQKNANAPAGEASIGFYRLLANLTAMIDQRTL